MEVHEKIRFLREAKNWSQEDMAEKLNMSISGYSKIERGETKAYIPKLEQIAEAFEVNLLELIPQNGNSIFLNNNNGSNIIGSPTELAFENQKLQLQLEMKDKELAMKDKELAMKDKELAMKDREIENLREIIALLKNKGAA